MDLDAEYGSLVEASGTPRPASAFSGIQWVQGGSNGTRNFALAFGCADSSNHPAVVVLRAL